MNGNLRAVLFSVTCCVVVGECAHVQATTWIGMGWPVTEKRAMNEWEGGMRHKAKALTHISHFGSGPFIHSNQGTTAANQQ